MGRKKKTPFKLNPDWMVKEPLDFEFNKYTLLDYLQKCEKNFENFEIYPDFIEISLHLANIQSLVKENTFFLTKKKFENCDDEIFLKDLIPQTVRNLSQEEEKELEKTIRFSGAKLHDAFNTARTIWNIAFDSLEIILRKNKENLISGTGYIYYHKKSSEKLYVWEYQIRNPKKEPTNTKLYLDLLYDGPSVDISLSSIIDKYSSLNHTHFYKDLPVFEMKCNDNFPMEQTTIPIMKRKVMSFVFRTLDTQKETN